VTLLTLIGADEAGDALTGILRRGGVTVHAVGGHRHRTTQKIRCVAKRHQLLRTDFEDAASNDCVADLCVAFGDVLQDDGVVVLSDYAKGALRHCGSLIDRARQRGCRVVCDPKGNAFERYRGADVLKPNVAELRAIVGGWSDEAELQKKCRSLRRRLGVGALLVTRGDEGMTLFDATRTRHHAANVRDVFDVSGAGDTVLATLAAFLAAGHALDDCVCWANRAAGLAVAKFGTATVTLAELEAAHGPLASARKKQAPVFNELETLAASISTPADRLASAEHAPAAR
jgi:rfaE bifunctional protein kinase chain/domain